MTYNTAISFKLYTIYSAEAYLRLRQNGKENIGCVVVGSIRTDEQDGEHRIKCGTLYQHGNDGEIRGVRCASASECLLELTTVIE